MSALLNRKVLALNKSWHPCSVYTLRRAIKMVWKGDAEIIDPTLIREAIVENGEIIIDPAWQFYTFTWDDWSKLRPKNGEDYIATARVYYRIPEIILLRDYNKLPQQRLNFSRRSLYRRDNNTCQYCGCKPGTEELTIDHVLPKSMGGRTTWENCVLACVACNSRKANRTPEQARMKFWKEGFKPFKPQFNLFKGDIRIKSWEHFLGEAYWMTELQD